MFLVFYLIYVPRKDLNGIRIGSDVKVNFSKNQEAVRRRPYSYKNYLDKTLAFNSLRKAGKSILPTIMYNQREEKTSLATVCQKEG